MEIGKRIKAHRALARRVYVSRQTISSWENDKTYPDVQSLLMLSEIFDATVDELIKGDVNTMTETIDRDVAIFKRLGAVITVFLLLMVAALVWLSVQMIVWDWTLAQTLPTIMLAFVLWGIAMAGSVWAERIKKDQKRARLGNIPRSPGVHEQQGRRPQHRAGPARAPDPPLDENDPHHWFHTDLHGRRCVSRMEPCGIGRQPAELRRPEHPSRRRERRAPAHAGARPNMPRPKGLAAFITPKHPPPYARRALWRYSSKS